MSKVKQVIPTIFIPGITGNTIVNSNSVDFQVLYTAIRRYFQSISPITLQVDEDFDFDPNVIAERSHIESLAYNELTNFLNPENGFNLYIFNYDWRKSNGTNGRKLKEYTEYLKKKLTVPNKVSVEKFNFLTHSMGSFIFRNYLTRLNENFDEVNNVVLTVPPFRGAVEALKMIVTGNSYLFNSSDAFRKVARTLPSLYEMLPVYPTAFDTSDVPKFDLFDPNQWQSNLYSKEDEASKKMLETRLKNAKEFITTGIYDLGNLPQNVKERIAIIVGEGEKTLDKVKMVPKNDDGWKVTNFFKFEEENLPTNSDGTVPLESATTYINSIQTIFVKSSLFHGSPIDIVAGQHAMFLTDGRVQTLIKRFLTDSSVKDWWKTVGNGTRN